MVQSMTGFGSAERDGYTVEIRSLNHRFLEIFVRLPASLARQEVTLRSKLKEMFGRGKFDVYVSVSKVGHMKLDINREAVGEVADALRALKGELGIEGEIDVQTLLPWKEIFMKEEISYDEAPLLDAFDEALEELEKMRLREGEALQEDISERLETVDGLNAEIRDRCPAIAEAARERFQLRLRDLFTDCGLEDARVMQEASVLAEKADISEEVSRIGSHVIQMKEALGAGGTIGRKLDFLLQELFRETNTMASKSDDPRVLRNVVEMKSEIERVREQVQNVQ
jgi:uncharacterized protein (TIGR00255 family)